jgi:hypothetical protein
MNYIITQISPKLMLTLFSLLSITLAAYEAPAGEVEDYIDKLKAHYQNTLSINTYSIKYHFLNRRYQDQNYWDYQTPNLYMSQRVVEVDLEKRQFYDNDIVYFAGGRLYDRAQFQSDTESYFYERSATVLGRAVEQRDMNNFDIFKSYNIMNIDFLAVRPLFEEANIEENIALIRDDTSGTTTFKHQTSDNKVVDYTFSDASLQLITINHRGLGGVFVYKDYQTTRGLTYARSVYQYYDGAIKPTYISFIDHFGIIDQIDPEKLKVPDGYGPVMPRGNGILEAEEIADGLYLVTDSSEVTNSLLKIDGDKITLFGAATSRTTAEKVLTFTAQHFPDKIIRSVYVTHPHGLQIFGLDVFAEQGIEVLADEYTIEAIKAYEPFAGTIDNFKFRTITHGQIIDGTHFYVLENLHSKRQGFVHFKDSAIIFQSSFMHVPKDNTIAKIIPSYTRTFMNFVKKRKLEVKRIVANYRNNNITPEVMKKISDVNF